LTTDESSYIFTINLLLKETADMGADQRLQLQVKSPHLEIRGISDPGRLRTENEDTIYLDQDGQFILLADGMGGHERGAEASETAIDIIKDFLSPKAIIERSQDIHEPNSLPVMIVSLYSLVDEAINKANTVLYERNLALKLGRFMGTTIAGLVLVEREYCLWFHIGDSRLYLMRDGNLKCLTTDHSAHKEWEERGMKGREPEKNIITRAVGPKDGVACDIKWDNWKQNDVYILCSDGLTDMIADGDISRIVSDSENIDMMTGNLVEAAIEAGGRDNVSVIVCRLL
jgi:protein phosphatase